MTNNFVDTDYEEKIPFDICVLYAIGRGDISQSDIYELWDEYWCEEEMGSCVFPMADIEFQLEFYSPIQIARMLSGSKFNLKHNWGCINNGDHLTSDDYLPFLIDLEGMMAWVDKKGNQSICHPVLYSLWVEWKKGVE